MNNDLINKINLDFGLKILPSWEEEKGGFLSKNYILSDQAGKKYFLKKYRFDEAERIAKIHRVKHFFAGQGVPVVLPIEDKFGQTFFVWDNSFYSLFPFVVGKHFERPNLPDQAIVSSAHHLAKIHLESKDGVPAGITDHNSKGWSAEEFTSHANQILAIIDSKESLTDFDRQARELILYKIDLVDNRSSNFPDFGLSCDHLAHGDYHDLNIFFDDNGQVKYIFDWEKAKLLPRLYEVVRFIEISCIAKNFYGRDFSRAKLFISSYYEQYPFAKEELRGAIQSRFVDSYHNLWVEKEHYLHHSNKIDHFLDHRDGKLEFYHQNLNTFVDQLMP